jgi:hypothetical protein
MSEYIKYVCAHLVFGVNSQTLVFVVYIFANVLRVKSYMPFHVFYDRLTDFKTFTNNIVFMVGEKINGKDANVRCVCE